MLLEGVSGYFSGFESIPRINVTNLGGCLPGVTLTAPDGYTSYQWYKGTDAISGAVSITYSPSLPGTYKVEVTNDDGSYMSAPQDVNDCFPEIIHTLTANKSSVKLNEYITFTLNTKYQSYFVANDLKVGNIVPSNIEILTVTPTYGTWSSTTKTWNIGTMNSGEEHVLTLLAKAVAVSTSSLTYTVSNTQTVYGTGGTLLTEGNSVADDNTETFTVAKGTATISTTSSITKTVMDPNFSITSTSSNTSVITYSSSNPGVASVNASGLVDLLNVGTTVITLSKLTDANYEATSTTVTLTVTKANPTLSSFADISKTYGDAAFELIAPSSNSDGSFTYSSSSASATISGNTVTLVGTGDVIITATQTGSTNFNSGSITATLHIEKADQTITIGALPTSSSILAQVLAAPVSLTASSTSGNGVSMSVPFGSIGTLSGTIGSYELYALSGSGIVSITYTAAGNVNFNTASKTVTYDVDKIPQVITFNPALSSSTVYESGLTITLTGTSSSSTSMIYVVESGPATVSGNTLSISGAGTVVVTANNAGDVSFTAAPEVRTILTITQAPTTLSDFNISDKRYLDATFTIPEPTSNRTGSYLYSSSDPTIATISGTQLIIYKPGSTVIQATQIATTNYKSASITSTFTVNKALPTLSGLSNITKLVTDTDFTVSVSSNLSSTIYYSSSNTAVATIDSTSGLVHILTEGTTTLSAVQSGTTFYTDGSISGVLTVQKGDSDGDGIIDAYDNCPSIANADQQDTDGDGKGDVCDEDDDDDGWSDVIEQLCGTNPLSAYSKPLDTDGDGISNCQDLDDDNDGCLDTEDAMPLDPTECADFDGDGIGDNADLDDDNDGQKDSDEIQCGSNPFDFTSMSNDFDGDGLLDCLDPDDDNDGCLDYADIFPFNSAECLDTDGDGIGNNEDTDDDNDGWSDEIELNCETNPLMVVSQPSDFDRDGIADCLDSDWDGDGVENTIDLFPWNTAEWTDNDNDGIGDNGDPDDDNDGCLDLKDDFPFDPLECSDTDKDGIGDNADLDDTNDGLPDDKLYVSGVLTPGVSGMEKYWQLVNIERLYPTNTVKVFTLNGFEVFSANNYQNDWDGTDKSGRYLSEGSYVYIINLYNTEKPIQGYLFIAYDAK